MQFCSTCARDTFLDSFCFVFVNLRKLFHPAYILIALSAKLNVKVGGKRNSLYSYHSDITISIQFYFLLGLLLYILYIKYYNKYKLCSCWFLFKIYLAFAICKVPNASIYILPTLSS